MEVITDLEGYENRRPGWVSIGNFDGVHRGHRAMLELLRTRAQLDRVPAIVFTFDPPPLALLNPAVLPPALTTLERKLSLLASADIDQVLVYPTDRQLLALTAREFFDQILRQNLHIRGLVEGPNFSFGKDRGGTVQTLADYCHEAQLPLCIAPSVQTGDRMISSSEIRRALLAGDIPRANDMLASRYELQGVVVPGAQRGRTLGFPTANLEGVATVIPAPGVYAVRVRQVTRQLPPNPTLLPTYLGAMNIGPNPTFAEERQKLEVHILDYAGDLYGQSLDVEFLQRIREVRKFAGITELRAQLEQDLLAVRALAAARE